MEELVDATEGGMPDNLTIELENRIKDYESKAQELSPEEALPYRVHQLAISKMLVNIHHKSLFKLVKAHANLGENYLNANYYQQALEHFTQAMKMNNSLFSQFEETKHYHSHILALLGRCYLESGNIDDGLELLNKSIKINKTLVGEEHVSNIQLYTLIAQAYEKKKEYDKSLEYLNMVWELAESKYGKKNETLGAVYLEMAKINMLKGNASEAISNQKHAYDIYIELENSEPSQVATILITLSEWHEKIDKLPDAIDFMTKAEKIFEQSIGLDNKDTCKVKRNLSLLLLKDNKLELALEQLKKVESLEKALYGEYSIHVGKTYKLIGTLFILMKNMNDAREFLLKAHKIFQIKHHAKYLKEVMLTMKKLQTTKDPVLSPEFSKEKEKSSEEKSN